MTLIIAAISPEVGYLAYDHLLSNDSGPVEEWAGVKGFHVNIMGDGMRLAFAGAAQGDGFNTREWLLAQIDDSNNASIQMLDETWRKRSSDLLMRIPEARRHLSIFILGRESGRIITYFLSNFEKLSGQPLARAKPANTLLVTREDVTEPRFLVVGLRTSILTTDGPMLLDLLSRGLKINEDWTCLCRRVRARVTAS
jgi:hypothetical protein